MKTQKTKNENYQIPTAKQEDLTAFKELFIAGLGDMYSAEKSLAEELLNLASKCTSQDLKENIKDHLEETKNQITRLEEVFSILNIEPNEKKCEAIEGLLEEAENLIHENKKGIVGDSAIIMGLQKIEHYEISTYGTLTAFAETLDEQKIVGLLEESLQEEKDADEMLSKIAISLQKGIQALGDKKTGTKNKKGEPSSTVH